MLFFTTLITIGVIAGFSFLYLSASHESAAAAFIGGLLIISCVAFSGFIDYNNYKKESMKRAQEAPAEEVANTATQDDSKAIGTPTYSGKIPVVGEWWCSRPDPNPYVDRNDAIKYCFKIMDVTITNGECYMKYKQYRRYADTVHSGFVTEDRCSMIDYKERERGTLVIRDSK